MTIEEMLQGLPVWERAIVQRLRSLAVECLPKATEKGLYGTCIPMFRRNRMICFIWPPSVYWGPNRTLEALQAKGVTLGFCQGNLMANEGGVLIGEGRKQFYYMYFRSFKDVNDEQVRALLFEAGMVDEGFSKKNKSKKRISRKIRSLKNPNR